MELQCLHLSLLPFSGLFSLWIRSSLWIGLLVIHFIILDGQQGNLDYFLMFTQCRDTCKIQVVLRFNKLSWSKQLQVFDSPHEVPSAVFPKRTQEVWFKVNKTLFWCLRGRRIFCNNPWNPIVQTGPSRRTRAGFDENMNDLLDASPSLQVIHLSSPVIALTACFEPWGHKWPIQLPWFFVKCNHLTSQALCCSSTLSCQERCQGWVPSESVK